jgi:peptidoglycan/LPS O-acetylase OafA/YrhL
MPMTQITDDGPPGKKRRFAALDSWRGLCACLVAAYHAPIYSHVFFAPLIRNAWLFVDFFFVLSGFVLSHAYFRKLGNIRQAVDFLIRRFGRLWPLHAATASVLIGYELFRLAGNLALGHPLTHIALAREPAMGALSILANALLLNSMGLQQLFAGRFEWNFPSWSISVEFYTCVLFALVSAVGGKRKNGILLILCVLAAGNSLLGNHLPDAPWAPFCRGVYGFMAGHFVYIIYSRTKTPMPAALEVVTMLATLIIVSVTRVGSLLSAATPIVFGVTVFVFAQDTGRVSRLFQLPFARKLGDWSYSIYLVHYLILSALSVTLNQIHFVFTPIRLPEFSDPVPLDVFRSVWYGDAALCIYMALVIGVASLTYRYIEIPARKFFYQLADARQARVQKLPVRMTATDVESGMR